MANLYQERSNNIVRTWGLLIGFFLVVMLIGWGISYYYNAPELLYVAVAFALITNVGSYWFSDKLVLSMTNAKPASREEFFDLYTVTENLAITAGLPMPKLYVIHDPAPNAFATGRDEKHAVVAATTGLLALLNRTELEGVIAHELSHIKNRDMLVMTIAVVLAGFVAAEVEPEKVRRVIACSGKVAYDLIKRRDEKKAWDVAILRVEQLYPFPHKAFASELKRYPNCTEVVWCQDEPQNQGAWFFVQHYIHENMLDGQKLGYAGRPASASPAVGYAHLHQEQQKALLDQARQTRDTLAEIESEQKQEIAQLAEQQKKRKLMLAVHGIEITEVER